MGQLASDVTEILNYDKSKKDAKNERQEILREIANDEKIKTNLVKKALAQQRAKYGASGMTVSGETQNAVLKRIQSETAQPYDDKRESNIKKMKKIKTSKPNILKTLLNRFDDLLG
ncbi:MAG: hypothetical protein KBS86_03245 [Proteobacteria bacterium]|nr:hypothetical protein [Candidatus Enterousia scatequi]